MSYYTVAILNLYFISTAIAVTVNFVVSVHPQKWPLRYEFAALENIQQTMKATERAREDKQQSVTVTQQTTQSSATHDNIGLEDLLQMKEKIQRHEQLRMQEQIEMQQELLQKQYLWMQEQIHKQETSTTPQETTKQEDPTAEQQQTTIVYLNETQHTTEYRTTIKKRKAAITMLHDYHHKRHKKRKNKTTIDHDKEKQALTTAAAQKQPANHSKHHHQKHTTAVLETTTENIFNTMSSQKVRFLRTPVPHKVKYNLQVQMYTLKILEIGTQVFEEMKNRTTDEAIITILEKLSELYTNKYKEFLNDTYKNEIKTRLGTQKAILDAVEVSDHILKRLINLIVIGLDRRGTLRENIDLMNDLQQEIRIRTDQQYHLLCLKLNVCRSSNGFPDFLNDFLTTILRCDDAKFQQAIDAITEVARDIDFSNVFHKKTRKQIKGTINYIEKQSLRILRPNVMILKNIIANKNRPIAIKTSDLKKSRVNSTIALLEILDAFEIKLPRSDANILEWGDLRTSLHEWAIERRNDVQDIMGIFMKHIKTALDGMPTSMQDHVAKNFGRLIRQN